MSYTIYDLSESLDRAHINRDDVARVVAAWGDQGDYAEWEGGFLLELKDGSALYIWGWCDTTGWGCQDGIETQRFDTLPDYHTIRPVYDRPGRYEGDVWVDGWLMAQKDWDEEPADLNRYIRGEVDGWGDSLEATG